MIKRKKQAKAINVRIVYGPGVSVKRKFKKGATVGDVIPTKFSKFSRQQLLDYMGWTSATA